MWQPTTSRLTSRMRPRWGEDTVSFIVCFIVKEAWLSAKYFYFGDVNQKMRPKVQNFGISIKRRQFSHALYPNFNRDQRSQSEKNGFSYLTRASDQGYVQ
jgi:hypothetical protein